MADSDNEIPPNATVYVRNLDDRVKIPVLVETLRNIFSNFGTIVEIVAKKNLKAKGQAFIVYDNADSAQDAIDEIQAFEIFGKQMRLEFAKTRSDATVKRESGAEELEKHQKNRMAERERKKALEASEKEKQNAKRAAEDSLAERPAKTAKPPTGIVPDEYLPPNKILFLRELPEDYTKEALTAIFGRYPGFQELRMVPTRKGIAFAEYETPEQATTVKQATANLALSGKPIRVTYQRQ